MEEEGILNAWKKKMLISVTTTTAKMMASSHPNATLSARLFVASLSIQPFSFRETQNSKTTRRPKSHHQFPCQATQST